MGENYQQRWEGVKDAVDEDQAVRALAGILADRSGRDFIKGPGFGENEAALCVRILDSVSCDLCLHPFRRLRWFLQGIARHNLNSSEKFTFFVTLRRLAERHGQLPSRIIITEDLGVPAEALAHGGFGVVKPGTYRGARVAVKSAVAARDADFQRMKKVSIDSSFATTLRHGLNNSAPAIL